MEDSTKFDKYNNESLINFYYEQIKWWRHKNKKSLILYLKGDIVMGDFILNSILWTLALYGLIEIIKTIINIYTYTNLKSDGIYIIVAVKNQEDKIEGFLRNFLFRIIYGKEESVKDIIVADLDSTDDTINILNKLQKDYDEIKVANWKECKEIMENMKERL